MKAEGCEYVIVHYHGDGGQACIQASRTFSNTPEGRSKAASFAVFARNEKGHHCGKKSVSITGSTEFVPDKGW